jgi:hypothetical protein
MSGAKNGRPATQKRCMANAAQWAGDGSSYFLCVAKLTDVASFPD